MRWLINLFAVIGLFGSVIVIVIYFQGLTVVRELDPKAAQVFGEFARRSLDQGVASANMIKFPLADGVSRDDAITSMQLRANERNIKLVGRLPFHEEVRALTGEDYPYLEIFQFCDALTAARLLDYNRDFAVYMPCSITLFEDDKGRNWLATMNLDMLIYGGRALDPQLKERVLAVKQGLLDIMAAGVNGSL
jgi:uncharacterized protein (DUF302 family)